MNAAARPANRPPLKPLLLKLREAWQCLPTRPLVGLELTSVAWAAQVLPVAIGALALLYSAAIRREISFR